MTGGQLGEFAKLITIIMGSDIGLQIMYGLDRLKSLLNRTWSKLDSRFDILPIRAPSTIWAVSLLSFPLFLSPFGYVIWGCQTDWVTISGFAVDIFGALILAIPDLPKYNEWAFGGRVREAHLRLMHDEKPGRFAPNTRYYDEFTDALRERLIPSHVPENGYFDIELMGGDYVMIPKDEKLDSIGVGPISIGNIERELTAVYHSEEGTFRRIGVFLIVVGFTTQLLSMVFDQFLLFDLCNLC